MKIIHKLIIGFSVVILLIWIVGYFGVYVSRKALQKLIGESSVSFAVEILNQIDRDIHSRIEQLQAYSKNLGKEEELIRSNQEFDKLDNVQEYIDEKDEAWRAAGKEKVTSFMSELINNELSKQLREEIELREFYEERYGYKVVGEVFVTNKYGANVAQTGKTTDYRQDDEEWWQKASKDDLYVADVEYDTSADVYSTDIGIRINDEKGDFIGVMKVVLNIEEVINIIKEAETTAEYETTEIKLINREGKIISDSAEEYRLFQNISDEEFFKRIRGDTGYFIKRGETTGEGEELVVYVRSKGYRNFEGLGWILLMEYQTEEIFAPVTKLRNGILIISLAVTILAVLTGFFISRFFSNRVTKLRAAAIEIGRGNLDTQIAVESNDEIGQLASSFKKMTEDLKKTTTSILNLNKEIAERKKVEETLRKSENKYRTLLENLPQKIFFKDQNSVYISCNESYARDLKIKPEEITGMTDYDFHPKELAEKYRADDKKIMKSAETEDIEEEYIQNGKKVFVHTVKTPVKDGKGNVVGILGIFWDITERKKAEEALWESQERYRALVENTILGIAILDTNYKIIMVNPTFARLFKKSASDFVGKYCFREFEKREAVCAHCPGRRAMASGKTEEVETQGVRDDGSRFYVRNRAVPFFGRDGAMRGFIEMVEDIDERKKAEKELARLNENLEQLVEERTRELEKAQERLVRAEKLAAIGALASGVGHELRNPLGAVKNAAYYLKRKVSESDFAKENPRIEEFLDIMENEIDASDKIIENLLGFARTQKPVFRPSDINEVLESALSIVRQPENIELVKELNTELPLATIDPDQVRQVFINMVSNAYQAMPEGGQLKIVTRLNQSSIEAEFSDTGCGMKDEILSQIFEPLYTTKAKGIGLGLAVSKAIVEGHNGEINVRSEIRKGTTFTIKLLIEQKEEE